MREHPSTWRQVAQAFVNITASPDTALRVLGGETLEGRKADICGVMAVLLRNSGETTTSLAMQCLRQMTAVADMTVDVQVFELKLIIFIQPYQSTTLPKF